MAHFEIRIKDQSGTVLEYLGIEEFSTLDVFSYLEEKYQLNLSTWQDRGYNPDIIMSKINFVEYSG